MDDFVDGLEASTDCGNTVANVSEEQQLGLMKQIVYSRLSKSRDVGPAMASAHVDLHLKNHPSRREDLIKIKAEQVSKAAAHVTNC